MNPLESLIKNINDRLVSETKGNSSIRPEYRFFVGEQATTNFIYIPNSTKQNMSGTIVLYEPEHPSRSQRCCIQFESGEQRYLPPSNLIPNNHKILEKRIRLYRTLDNSDTLLHSLLGEYILIKPKSNETQIPIKWLSGNTVQARTAIVKHAISLTNGFIYLCRPIPQSDDAGSLYFVHVELFTENGIPPRQVFPNTLTEGDYQSLPPVISIRESDYNYLLNIKETISL